MKLSRSYEHEGRIPDVSIMASMPGLDYDDVPHPGPALIRAVGGSSTRRIDLLPPTSSRR